jgi:WhiB family redox-sensing transcriptional regulator
MSILEHLPGAHSDSWEWQLRGVCRSKDPEMFFHPENERGAARQAREAAAKAVCAQCPVLATCREHARVSRERYGVWGGLSESEREQQLMRLRLGPSSCGAASS